MKGWIAILSIGFLSACGADDSAEQTPEDSVDLCEAAAQHRAECTGNYVTPPICDEASEAAAQNILEVPCEEFSDEFEATGKADGAFCDWFGTGCTPDEPIFGGPRCESNSECAVGFCAEGRCFEGVNSDEFSGVIGLYTETEEVEGGSTKLLDTNGMTRDLRRQLVQEAQSSVHFSAFIIQDDEVGWEMAQDFIDAAQRGVEVRVLVDATTQYFASYPLIEEMAANGVQVLAFNPLTEWALIRTLLPITGNDRLHEKLLVVDGKSAIIGGRNVGVEYLVDERWRDIDVLVEGPAVEKIQRMFLGIWDKNSELEYRVGCTGRDKYGFHCPSFEGESLVEDMRFYVPAQAEGSLKSRAIYSDPMVQETPLGYFATLALIRAAQESITISNVYFVPPRRLRKHLKAAEERGVDVKVITNSKTSTDGIWMYYASLNYYRELLEAGVEIYEYQGVELMHAKTMVVDGKVGVIGSFNIDPRSAVDNSESLLIVREDAVIAELLESYQVDLANSTLASGDIPLSEMLKAKAHRLIEPLL